MSIDLESVNSGYNLSTINTNFSTIETYINDNVLHRKGNVAGEALMTRDLDMNGYSILNADIDTSNFTNDRAIRVPTSEGTIAALPIASERAGKILSFSPVDGLPIVTAPVSGSAVDVLNQLALGTGSTLVGYKLSPAATSVTRTIRDKLDEIVSVKDFGAKGDGVTDDTAAIQACFTWSASQSRGVTVKVPPGSYILSSQIAWEGGNSQIFLDSENSGNTYFSWTQASTSQGLKGGLTTPISRFSARGITFVTNAVTSSACIEVNFNSGSPKSLIMVDCSGYGAAVGGTAANGYWGNGLIVTKDPVYPIFEHCYFFGIGGATSVAKSNLIQSGFRITSSGGVFFSNFRNCFANNVNNGVWLMSTSSPGIEGTCIESCNFNSCNIGVYAQGELSGVGAYYPPQVFINNSQIEYIQRAVAINHHSRVDIRGCLFYADPTADVALTHLLLSNVNNAIVTDNHMESRPVHTALDGVVVNGTSSYVQVKNNQIKTPTSHYAIVFSDSSSNCTHSGNTATGGALYINNSSNAGTNSQVEYNASGQVSTNLQGGVIMKAGSSVLTLGAGGTFTIAFTQAFPSTNISTVVSNGDINSSMANVVISGRNNSGFSGTFIGASSGTAVRVNFYAIGV
ncbi:hypothetical protein [Erwinia phage Pecta]|nr:hypothetical protein [Erwinia phage Pecta]